MIYQIDFTTVEGILLVILLCVTLIRLFYLWFFFSRLAFRRKKTVQSTGTPVSVVICARNEYRNLKRFLPLILAQEYPVFEVIVVNHASQDKSSELLDDMKCSHPNLKIVEIKEELNFFHGKKFPLSIGIKSAKYDNILLTDADCKPSGEKWIESMVAGLNGKKEIALGYSPAMRNSGILNFLARFDIFHTGMLYLSAALAGLPYMGVGRNLAYKKEVFFRNKGFTSHYRINSGDDDLFINKAASGKNISVISCPESHMVTIPKKTFITWFRQKRRHIQTSVYYKTKHKVYLSIYHLSQYLFIPLSVTLALVSQTLIPLACVYGFFLLNQLFVVKKCALKLNEKNLLLISPLYDMIIIILYPALTISRIFSRKDKWK